jgi:hypothetical protein
VEDVNEAPIIVRNGMSDLFYVDENAIKTTVIGSVIAVDPERDTLVYDIANGKLFFFFFFFFFFSK